MEFQPIKDDGLWHRTVAELAVLLVARGEELTRVQESIPERESARRLNALTEALDAIDELGDGATVKDARAAVRALMDKSAPAFTSAA